jgi:hypothetical protein
MRRGDGSRDGRCCSAGKRPHRTPAAGPELIKPSGRVLLRKRVGFIRSHAEPVPRCHQRIRRRISLVQQRGAFSC